MTSDQQLDLLRNCVALRVQARQVRESVRVGLASIEQSLAVHAGPLVRKTVAARLLGVSVQALDRHVAKGTIPVEPIAEGAKRSAIPIGPLLDIAYEQALAPETSLTSAIDAARERGWRVVEFGNADRLISFATRIGVSAWVWARNEGTSRPRHKPHQLEVRELLRSLSEHDVSFIVIGALALSAHWATRATAEVDIVPDLHPPNLERLWSSLQSMDATPLSTEDDGAESTSRPWNLDNLDDGGNWRIATRHGRLDIVPNASGSDRYAGLRAGAVDLLDPIAGRIWFAGRDDLIAMKRAAGRPQDLIDIERIEQEASRNE